MTTDRSPFCGYHYLFEMNINEKTVKTAGEILYNMDPKTPNSTVAITQ